MAAKSVTFVSNATQYFLLRRPKREIPVPDGSGGWITVQERVGYQFMPGLDKESGKLVGRLTVKEGQDKLATDHHGTLRADEDTGVERDAVTFLMAHGRFGQEFWIEGFAPGTIFPRPQDLRVDITAASVALDEERLATMLAEEQRTHGRADLLRELEIALLAVREERAKLAAQQAENAVPLWEREGVTNAQLQAACDERGLTVAGTGTNGNVLKADLVKALAEAESVPA